MLRRGGPRDRSHELRPVRRRSRHRGPCGGRLQPNSLQRLAEPPRGAARVVRSANRWRLHADDRRAAGSLRERKDDPPPLALRLGPGERKLLEPLHGLQRGHGAAQRQPRRLRRPHADRQRHAGQRHHGVRQRRRRRRLRRQRRRRHRLRRHGQRRDLRRARQRPAGRRRRKRRPRRRNGPGPAQRRRRLGLPPGRPGRGFTRRAAERRGDRLSGRRSRVGHVRSSQHATRRLHPRSELRVAPLETSDRKPRAPIAAWRRPRSGQWPCHCTLPASLPAGAGIPGFPVERSEKGH